jgi:hypothetical protein
MNYNLRLKSFEHCVKASSAKALIYGSEFSHGKMKVRPRPLKHMHLLKTHGRVIIIHNYTVILDVLATGGLKYIPMLCKKDQLNMITPPVTIKLS